MEPSYCYFVGIDWATQVHEAAICDVSGKKIFGARFENNATGLSQLCRWIETNASADRNKVAIAIEVPRGGVVETLIEQGFHTFSINPKQLDRFRDRHTTAGCKDDRLDAFVLSDSLRTDMHCFKQIKISEPQMIELRELSRLDAELSETRNRLCNQLREQLLRFHPELLKLSPAGDEPWFWELLVKMKPSALVVKKYKIQDILTSHRIRRFDAETVYNALKLEHLHVADGTIASALRHIASIVAQLKVVNAERIGVRNDIEKILDELQSSFKNEHRDVAILCSLPGVGKLTAATVLAEASQAISERDIRALRAHAGIAPVTKRSGKKLVVNMRQACNDRLRNALYHWTRVSVQRDAVSRSKYAALRARGHSHGRAIRGVSDSLLRTLFAMLRNGTLFDKSKRLHA